MNPSLVLRSSAFAAFLATALSAHAVVLDFEELTGTPGSSYITLYGSPVLSLGFSLAAAGSFSGFEPGNNGTLGFNYTGSVALSPSSSTTLTKADGGAFSLLSMSVANLYRQQYVPDVGQISFTGTHADGTTVTQRYTTTLDDDLHTVTFSGFTDLTSVSWAQGYPFHQFDNITVTPVPEPATLTMVGLGIIALLRKRRTH